VTQKTNSAQFKVSRLWPSPLKIKKNKHLFIFASKRKTLFNIKITCCAVVKKNFIDFLTPLLHAVECDTAW